LGNVQQLLASVHATSQVAPNLSDALRESFQKQQIPSENIKSLLDSIKSLNRYDRAFKLLWAYCTVKGHDPSLFTCDAAASHIVEFNKVLPHEARHAYSALLHFPKFEGLRFHSLLKQCRRQWNQTSEKYSTFWDPSEPLQRLLTEALTPGDLLSLRTRLVLALRIFMLYRSVDLSRMLRTVSLFQGKPWVLVQRKGWTAHKWEKVICVPGYPDICPWTLLQKYVEATKLQGKSGGPVFLSLQAPWKPLSANALGSITKREMKRLGLPTDVWQPHSTRGAGVLLYKKWGFSSEEVCEIGKWKNTGAFASHYLRLNAAEKAGAAVAREMVHTASPSNCEEPAMTRTPGNIQDPGGSVMEGDEQEDGEARFRSPAVHVCGGTQG